MNHAENLSPSRPENLSFSSRLKISLSSSSLKFQTRDQQLLHRNGFKAGLTTNLTPYSTVKSFVVGLRITLNCRWRLLGHDEWRRWLQGQFGGTAVVGMGIFLIFWFGLCLGLRCDVWWLEWFGFEEDGWVVMGGAVVAGGCWVTMLTNGSGFCFEFCFIFLDLFEVWCKQIYLRWDVGWLIGWADLCLIALYDTGSNWVDLGLMEGGFLFWNVM